MMRGIERGDYHLPNPDLGQMLLLDSMAGLSPKPLGVWGCLLSPLVYLVQWALVGVADRAAARCNRSGNAGVLGRANSRGAGAAKKLQ